METLKNQIIRCRACPRLTAFRQEVPKRAAYQKEHYWRKPIPGFGDPKARLIIIGLAPSPHGANRTGRIFTGDESARFLMKGLHAIGFTNQPTSLHRNDHLKLKNCYITAIVKCVPPGNKPSIKECETCEPFLLKEMELLRHKKVILTLGSMAFKRILHALDHQSLSFAHGAHYILPPLNLFASYHPSPQNTYTGKLTEKMFVDLLRKIKKYL
jgi:uracil-DNA glycosylase family 4